MDNDRKEANLLEEKPEMSSDAPKHEPPVFDDRSPENLEKFYDFVEEFQTKDIEFKEEPHKLNHLPQFQQLRARTPNRLKYEAQVTVIKRQIGDLEQIRQKLGLSRRKMCQLLLVDPSAWSRWSKEGAPPHVYRALEWYLLLMNKTPAHAHSYWITASGGRSSDLDYSQLLEESKRLQAQSHLLSRKVKVLQILIALFYVSTFAIVAWQILNHVSI